LVAFDHAERQFASKITDRTFEQCRFAGARRTDQIKRQNLTASEPGTVLCGQLINFGENPAFDVNSVEGHAVLGSMSMTSGMFVQVVRVMMTMVNVVVRARIIMVMIMRIVGSACVLMIGGDRRRLAGLQIK